MCYLLSNRTLHHCPRTIIRSIVFSPANRISGLSARFSWLEKKFCDFCFNGVRNMDKVLDSLREKGILTDDIQDKFSNLLPDHAKEKLSSIFQRYQDLDSEGKQQFMDEVVEMFRKKLQSSSSLYSLYYTLFYSQPYTIFIFAVLFIAFILVFFVYKLFKCLSERESKREEKKKNKQMKKKK